jgi:hypothetical protein
MGPAPKRFAQNIKSRLPLAATFLLQPKEKTMENVISQDKRATWETYASAWKVPSAPAKAAALRASAVATCVYRDPLTRTDGHQALIDYMLDFHRQVPGGHFETTYFLSHHERSIARWNMVNDQGVVIGEGISYGEYDDHGKLVAMTGFFAVAPQ